MNIVKQTRIRDLKKGDTVVFDGSWVTVGNNDIKKEAGEVTIFGKNEIFFPDKKISQVTFPKWHKGEIIRHVTQL